MQRVQRLVLRSSQPHRAVSTTPSKPSVASFNERIRAAVDARNEEAMLSQLDEMKRLEVAPDVTTYTLYLRYYQQTWPQRRAEREAQARAAPNRYDALVKEVVAQHERDAQIAAGSSAPALS